MLSRQRYWGFGVLSQENTVCFLAHHQSIIIISISEIRQFLSKVSDAQKGLVQSHT